MTHPRRSCYLDDPTFFNLHGVGDALMVLEGEKVRRIFGKHDILLIVWFSGRIEMETGYE